MKFNLFLFTLCWRIFLGHCATNGYDSNYVIDDGVLYSVGTCISFVNSSNNAKTTTFAYECRGNTTLRKHQWNSDGLDNCLQGASSEYTDFYASSPSLIFYCSGYDYAVMWDTNDPKDWTSCDNPTYQINSTVPYVCLPHPTKLNVYYQYTCLFYTMYYEEYSVPDCSNVGTIVYTYDSSCNTSVQCSSFETYLEIGYNTDIWAGIIGGFLGSLASAIIIASAVVCGICLLTTVCCCCGCCRCSICPSCAPNIFFKNGAQKSLSLKASTEPTPNSPLLKEQSNEGIPSTSVPDAPVSMDASQACKIVVSGDVIVEEIHHGEFNEGAINT